MRILDAIQYVAKKNAHPKQLRYDFMFERKYDLILAAASEKKHKKVLDVGCAYGTMSFVLALADFDVTAVDVMPELHAKELFDEAKIKFQTLNVETGKIQGKYDLIIFTDTLEHLCYNPLPVMKKLYDALEPGGEIIITTPSKENDFVCDGNWCDLVNWKQIPGYEKYKFNDAHNHTYYIWEIRELLEEAGFEINFENYLPMENLWFIRAEK